MADRGPFEFVVTIWGSRASARNVLEQFIDGHEDWVMEATMEGRRLPDMTMSVSGIRRSKPTPSDGSISSGNPAS